MNQILSVNTKKKKIKKVGVMASIEVFAIILLIFGFGMISSGVFSYYNIVKENKSNSTSDKPVITMVKKDENIIRVKIDHNVNLKSIFYSINNSDENQVNENDVNKGEFEIKLKDGTSIVKVTAIDVYDIMGSYESTFDVKKGPKIYLEKIENKIQVTVESEINIKYVKYYWDDDEENAKNYTINDVKNVTLIDVPEGPHTLKVMAEDEEGNLTPKTQKVIGDKEPDVTVTTNKKAFIIRAFDDEEITKVEITFNSEEQRVKNVGATQYRDTIDLVEGENKIIVTVYNKNGVYKTVRVKYTKE